MNNSHRQLLKQNYEKACNAYLEAFCHKHNFQSSYWIANRVGEIADCNEFFSVDMADIRTDIDEDAPEKEFFDWYDYYIDASEFNITAPNFHNWLHGCPRTSQDEFKALRKQKQELMEACRRAEKSF